MVVVQKALMLALTFANCLKQNPIPSFHLPIQLSDWFQQQRMKTKRNEIKELILRIQQHQEEERKQPELPSSSEEPEIQQTSVSRGPDLPVGP